MARHAMPLHTWRFIIKSFSLKFLRELNSRIVQAIQTCRHCLFLFLSASFKSPIILKTVICTISAKVSGCDSFGPEPIWSPDFWSPTFYSHGQIVTKNLVPMDKWSPTNLVPLDKRSPSNLVPLDKWSPKIWSPWTNGPQPIWSPYFQIITAYPHGQTEYFRDHLYRGTKLVGDYLSMGTEFLGTTCPWGQEVGDQKSGDQMGSGPNESQP